ncbi:putative dipeptidyl aminopeptidase [Moniliophthora roreri]|nr:putative dipeptidyl aminopeptidase [Moniliophthora roreri]
MLSYEQPSWMNGVYVVIQWERKTRRGSFIITTITYSGSSSHANGLHGHQRAQNEPKKSWKGYSYAVVDRRIFFFNMQGFNHIALFSPPDSGECKWITQGEWEVVGGVKGVDEERGAVLVVYATTRTNLVNKILRLRHRKHPPRRRNN